MKIRFKDLIFEYNQKDVKNKRPENNADLLKSLPVPNASPIENFYRNFPPFDKGFFHLNRNPNRPYFRAKGLEFYSNCFQSTFPLKKMQILNSKSRRRTLKQNKFERLINFNFENKLENLREQKSMNLDFRKFNNLKTFCSSQNNFLRKKNSLFKSKESDKTQIPLKRIFNKEKEKSHKEVKNFRSRIPKAKQSQRPLLEIENFYLLFWPFPEAFIEKFNKSQLCNKSSFCEKQSLVPKGDLAAPGELRRLQSLFALMETILNGKKLSRKAVSSLNSTEKFIFEAILKKKMYQGIDSVLKRLKRKKTEEVTFKNQIVSEKRKEERLKFVFRLIIKEMQRAFCDSRKAKRSLRGDQENEFYLHYFERFVGAKLTTLNSLKTPYFKAKGQGGRNKTLNKVFLTHLNFSIAFANRFNEMLLEIICVIIPFVTSSKKFREVSRVSRNIISSIQSSSRNELFKKIFNWELKLKRDVDKVGNAGNLQKIGKEIDRKVFKFPWTIWEVKNAFVMTLLSFNEFRQVGRDQVFRLGLPDSHIDHLEANSNLKKRLKTSKQKENYIKNQLKDIKRPEAKFYWMGVINRNVFGFGGDPLLSAHSEAPLKQAEFLRQIKSTNQPKKVSIELRLHIYIVIFNLLINSSFKEKYQINKLEVSQKELTRRFRELCANLFEKLESPLQGKECKFLGKCPLLENFFQKIPDINFDSLLRTVPTIKFISQANCLFQGIKNKPMLKDLCVFLDNNLKTKTCNINLKHLLKMLLIQK